MPKLKKKWSEISESTGGGFFDIEPGAYVLVITNVEPHESDEYVRIFWDVAEGERKGAYAQSQYPPSDVLSWKETAYGMLKHKLHVLADMNDGFQSTVAFEGDQWKQFVGKRFGATVRKRLYTAGPNSKTPGADKEAVEISSWIRKEDIEGHTYSDRLLAPRDQRDKSAAQQQAAQTAKVPDSFGSIPSTDVYAEDIPF